MNIVGWWISQIVSPASFIVYDKLLMLWMRSLLHWKMHEVHLLTKHQKHRYIMTANWPLHRRTQHIRMLQNLNRTTIMQIIKDNNEYKCHTGQDTLETKQTTLNISISYMAVSVAMLVSTLRKWTSCCMPTHKRFVHNSCWSSRVSDGTVSQDVQRRGWPCAVYDGQLIQMLYGKVTTLTFSLVPKIAEDKY